MHMLSRVYGKLKRKLTDSTDESGLVFFLKLSVGVATVPVVEGVVEAAGRFNGFSVG